MHKTLILLGFSLFALVGCQQKQWSTFTSAAGKFSVSMPGTPKEQKMEVPSPIGAIQFYLFTGRDRNYEFVASYNDYPASVVSQGNVEKMLDGARDGAVGNINGKLQSEKKITLKNFPGREIHVLTPDGKAALKYRIYLVGNRLYQVGIVSTNPFQETEKTNQFFESFSVTQ